MPYALNKLVSQRDSDRFKDVYIDVDTRQTP